LPIASRQDPRRSRFPAPDRCRDFDRQAIRWVERDTPMQHAITAIAILALPTMALAQAPPDQPQERTDANSRLAHQQLIDKARHGTIDVYFVGDSITRRWGATDYPRLLANWRENFTGRNAANFGWGGDATQNILWRLQNGELEGVRPKVFVILAGTNNLPAAKSDEDVEAIARGVMAIVDTCWKAAPNATVILMAIFPREDLPEGKPRIARLNALLEKKADGKHVRFLNINDRLVDEQGRARSDLFPDKLHPALPAYQIWADALKPIFTELLGPPATIDSAPPATGDPSAAKR
jgi:lysophospholipase L1-like esterase